MTATENPIGNLSPYELRHLTAHLEESGRITNLHRLLALETSGQRNAWYEAREETGEVQEYLDDIRRAWRCAELAYDSSDNAEAARAIGLQVRYSLMVTSINSQLAEIPVSLLVALVENKAWTPKRALSYARQAPEVGRGEKLVAPAPYLTEALGSEALAAATAIQDRCVQVSTLTQLIPLLSHSLRNAALQQALFTARRVTTPFHKALALRQVLEHVSGNERDAICQEALAAVQAVSDGYEQTLRFADLAPHLPESMRQEACAKAMRVAVTIQYSGDRAAELIKLIPHLPVSLLPQVLDAVSEMSQELTLAGPDASDVFVALAPLLSDGLRLQALAVARSIGYDHARVKALEALAPYLPPTVRDEITGEVAIIVQAAKDQQKKHRSMWTKLFEMFVRLFRHLTGFLEIQSIQRALTVLKFGWYLSRDVYVQALIDLIPYLSVLKNVLKSTRNLKWDLDRDLVVRDILDRLVNSGYATQALRLARSMRRALDRVYMLEYLAPHLEGLLRSQALTDAVVLAESMQEGRQRVELLTKLSALLPDSQKGDVLQKALKALIIGDSYERVCALATFAPYPSAAFNGEMLEAVSAVPSRRFRAHALLVLAYRWAMSVSAKAWRRPAGDSMAPRDLGLSKSVPEKARRTRHGSLVPALWYLIGLGSVLPFLLRDHLPLEGFMLSGLIERFPVVLFLGSICWLVLSVPQLVSYLPESARVVMLERLVVPAVHVLPRDNVLRWCWALPWIAPRLPKHLLPEALLQLWPSPRALKALAPYLSESLLEEVLSVLQQTNNRWLRLDMLRALIPHLAEPLVRRSIAMVREVQTTSLDLDVLLHRMVQAHVQARSDLGSAEEVLVQIALRLAELDHLREALTLVLPHSDSDWRSRALARLVPYLTALSPDDLCVFWREILHEVSVHHRKDLSADLCALRPVIVALAGQAAIATVFCAIQDVGHWWP